MSDEGTTPRFSKVRPLSATVAVVRELQSMIDRGELAPGTRLPGERILAAKLGVSRPTLREAIRALRLMGMVESYPGRGTFVSSDPAKLEVGRPSQPSTAFNDPGYEPTEILQMRAIVESGFARLVALNPRQELLETIPILEKQLLETETLDDLIAADLSVHAVIAANSNNAPLLEYMDSMRTIISVVRSRQMGKATDHFRTKRDLMNLLEAIRAGRADRAAEAMWEHLTHVQAPFVHGLV